MLTPKYTISQVILLLFSLDVTVHSKKHNICDSNYIFTQNFLKTVCSLTVNFLETNCDCSVLNKSLTWEFICFPLSDFGLILEMAQSTSKGIFFLLY